MVGNGRKPRRGHARVEKRKDAKERIELKKQIPKK
jgi:hypothetical protein